MNYACTKLLLKRLPIIQLLSSCVFTFTLEPGLVGDRGTLVFKERKLN